MTGDIADVALVRPYAVTGGRTSCGDQDLPLETLLLCNDAGSSAKDGLFFERAEVVRMCAALTSVVEISARLRLPLGVARVLVSDLHAEGLLDVHLPNPRAQGPDEELLGKVLDGLQRL